MMLTPGQPDMYSGIGAVNYHTGETVVAIANAARATWARWYPERSPPDFNSRSAFTVTLPSAVGIAGRQAVHDKAGQQRQ